MDEPFERLADTRPPRYSIESDDEEDEPNPLGARAEAHPPPDVVIKMGVQDVEGKPMILGRGTAGRVWARGVQLGEQLGGVYVNGKQVGLVFLPAWSGSVVIVSELTTALPSWAQQPFATAVVGYFKPSDILILDSYASATYSSNERTSLDNAPTRFLGFGKRPQQTSDLKLFAPPNVISSTTAAIISTMYLRSYTQSDTSCYAVLIPTRYPAQPTHEVESTNFLALNSGEGEDEWGTDRILEAHQALVGSETEWKGDPRARGHGQARRRGGGEGMYI